MGASDDLEITRQFVKQPELYFEAVYKRYSSPLFRFIYRFTENREAADEILHETFVQLIAGKFSLEADASVKSWLFTVAKNKSLNYVKHARRPLPVASESFDPREQLNTDDLLRQLSNAMTKLPDDLANVWRLRQSGLDNAAIAMKLEIPLGTVKSRFFRLVEFLKKEFQHEN